MEQEQVAGASRRAELAAPYSAVNIAYTARDNLDQIHPPPLSPQRRYSQTRYWPGRAMAGRRAAGGAEAVVPGPRPASF